MKKVFITLIIFGLGFMFGILVNKLSPTKITENPIPDTRLDTLISLDTPQGILDISVYKDEIYFEPFENVASPYKSFSISKDGYPELFKQGVANSSFISAKVVKDEKSGKSLVIVSNNQPDHGGYLPTYQLTINPIEGKATAQ